MARLSAAIALTLFLCCSLQHLARAYKAFEGLSFEERTRCINATCALDKSLIDVFVVGDTGGISIDLTHTIGTYHSTRVQQRLAAAMAQITEQHRPDFFLTLGDNIYWNGVEDKCDKRFEILFEEPYLDGRFLRPWYMIAGNHDHLGNIQAQIDYSQNKGKWTFPALYYKVSYSFAGSSKRADFIFIDTILMCGLTVDPDSRSVAAWLWKALTNRKKLTGPMPQHVEQEREQWLWLERQLSQSKADYIFVSGHYPIHSISSHGPTQCLIEKLDPLLRKHNVSAYLAGHDHTLQFFRKRQTDTDGKLSTMHYIVSGLGSRIDPSESHMNDNQTKDLLYRYPKYEDIAFMRRALRTYLIGHGYGGFVRLEVRPNETEVSFYAGKDAQLQFRATIPPRSQNN